jgi:hypothetical protein
MVKGVERLRSELETYSFGELKQFTQAYIPVVDPGLDFFSWRRSKLGGTRQHFRV